MFTTYSPYLIGTILLSFYCFSLVIYRLFFSPIASFPGSKVTAITGWYETYLDVVKGGQFTYQIEKWHRQYGPIIRINPTELHISEPDFHDVVYSTAPYDKVKAWRDRSGVGYAANATVEHDLHHSRRAALNPYFSKRQINDFTPYIQERAVQLCERLLREYKGTSKVVTVNDAWAAFAADIIMYYGFAWSYDFVSYPDFKAPFTTSMRELVISLHVAGHFPLFRKFMESVPDFLVGIINPAMRPMFDMQRELKSQIIRIISGENQGHKNVAHKTVFSDILASRLPAEEKSVTRLQQEAFSMVGAAIETTKATLTLATFYILFNPEIERRLLQELRASFPDPTKSPTLSELERLPYLTAIIQEALRLSYGVAQRLPRLSPTPVRYNSRYTIPANTPFSMSAYIQHNNPILFPDPKTFNPDRWLNNPRAAAPYEGLLTRYLVSFSRGTRICLGMHLAWAELYIGLATLFRRAQLELFETGPEAVAMAREYVVPLPREGGRGVRVRVRDGE